MSDSTDPKGIKSELKFPLVVPTIKKDLPILLNNLDLLIKNLPVDKIYVIGPSDIKSLIDNPMLSFVEETELVNINQLKTICKTLYQEGEITKRIGWYVQQFIKMKFSQICEDEYYLLWDSDTIPTKKIELFSADGKPYFDLKTEYHKPYFDTIERILPGCKKQITLSFISEHMLINTHYMREMISEIERNEALAGDNFMEKILNAINPQDICNSGFSEFETFGTYMQNRHPDFYSLRNWKSMRYGAFFFNNTGGGITKTQLDWLSKHYDAISLEKGHNLSLAHYLLRFNLFYSLNPHILDFLAIPIRIKNRIFK